MSQENFETRFFFECKRVDLAVLHLSSEDAMKMYDALLDSFLEESRTYGLERLLLQNINAKKFGMACMQFKDSYDVTRPLHDLWRKTACSTAWQDASLQSIWCLTLIRYGRLNEAESEINTLESMLPHLPEKQRPSFVKDIELMRSDIQSQNQDE